jgi:uncharacterized protein
MATAVAADGAPSAGTHPSVPASAHLAALGWLLLSSPLVVVPPGAAAQLASFTDGESAAITRWLHSLQADSQALVAWMQAKPEVRIGRYAERLLEFYLSHAPSSSASPVAAHAPSHLSPHLSPHSSPQQSLHSLVAAHVPLRSEVNGLRVTQGELDFLLTNAQGQHLHWELAVKFFLCTATGDVATPADFIGPNGVETLAHKWHKLFARQLTHMPPRGMHSLGSRRPLPVAGCFTAGVWLCRNAMRCTRSMAKAGGQTLPRCTLCLKLCMLTCRACIGWPHWHR